MDSDRHVLLFIEALFRMAPKLKKAQISTSNRVDKQIVYIHTKEYYMATEKSKLLLLNNNMRKSHKYNIKQKKPDKKSTYYDFFIYIKKQA